MKCLLKLDTIYNKINEYLQKKIIAKSNRNNFKNSKRILNTNVKAFDISNHRQIKNKFIY